MNSARRTSGPFRAGSPSTAGPQAAPECGAPPTFLAALPRFLIIRTGSTAPEVQRGHGDYERWFRDALSDHDVAFDLCDATREAIPDPSLHRGILVTGSVKSVLKPEPWMETLSGFLAGADRLGVPVLCVCFGCQALARARGGRVVRSPAGYEIGAVEVTLTSAARLDPLFEGLPSPMPVLATHEDRVESLPPGDVLLAGNAAAPIQAFRAGESVWGVQFHPEATTAILRELIVLRRERLEAEARAREPGPHMAQADPHGARPALPARAAGRSGGSAEPGSHIDRLLRGLDRFDPLPARRLLGNFVRLCLRGRDPDRTM